MQLKFTTVNTIKVSNEVGMCEIGVKKKYLTRMCAELTLQKTEHSMYKKMF